MNVTYADLFQFCMFIVALIGLCYQIFKDNHHHPSNGWFALRL